MGHDGPVSEANQLRRNLARYLAPMYRADPVWVARECDEELDKTGALLGMVREEVMKLPPERHPPTGHSGFGERGTGG